MLYPLTIITINFNNAKGLADTIASVINQSYKDYRYIIIDGGSTDGSVDIIKSFQHTIHYWISETDSGIYNAMNKGIRLVENGYILFLNSGDVLAGNNVLEDALPTLNGEYIVYANISVNDGLTNYTKVYPDKLKFSHFFFDSLPHSGGSFFLKQGFVNELSFYDETLKIVSDWKWYLQAIFKYNYSYKHIQLTTGIFDFTGISSTNAYAAQEEKSRVFKKEFPLIEEEITELLAYKRKYETLESSRVIKIHSAIRNFLRL